MNAFDTIVVGAGQAGLAAGYHLKRAGARFTLLDAGAAVGDAWRDRWSSLRLFTPARYNALPGLHFPGEGDALPGKDEVAAYLASYARRFELPIRSRSAVTRLHREAGRFVVTTAAGVRLEAASVIVATGANQRPHVPSFADDLDPRIVQLHSSRYRDPQQVPEGRVLVVGAGNSGAQVALDLAAAGRAVVLSGRATGALPRRFLGRDLYDWLWPTLMRPTIDSTLGRWLMRGRLFRGDPLIGIPRQAIAQAGIARTGRTAAAQGGFPIFEDGTVLRDLAAIVWCTGYRPDFDWIDLPVLGFDGYPLHRRGLALGVPGLAFLGMRFQSRYGSALLGGVGEDAAYVVDAIHAGLLRSRSISAPADFSTAG